MPSTFQRWKESRHGLGVSLVLLPVQSLEFLFFESDDHKVEPEKEEKCHKEKERVVEHQPPAKEKYHDGEIQRMPYMSLRTLQDQGLSSGGCVVRPCPSDGLSHRHVG